MNKWGIYKHHRIYCSLNKDFSIPWSLAEVRRGEGRGERILSLCQSQMNTINALLTTCYCWPDLGF